MKIAIDCRMINSSGVGVYLQGCLPFLLASGHDFLLVGGKDQLSAYSSYNNVKIFFYDKKTFSFSELLLFPRALKTEINTADCYFSPYFNIPCGITVPVYTTIHDLVFLDIPELVSRTGLAARRWFYHRAIKHSRKVFTVSEFSKSRILFFFGGKTPIVNAYNGIKFHKEKTFYSQKTKTILFVGNIKKHKGLDILLEAFLETRKSGLDYKLIIVGSGENFRSKDSAVTILLKNSDPLAIEFTGRISSGELIKRIRESALLVQPSLYEGFGYPPLESMMLGTQALVSDIPVFREIYKNFPVIFFRAGNAADLREKLVLLLYGTTPERITLTEAQKNEYTFEKTVAKILKELEKDGGGCAV